MPPMFWCEECQCAYPHGPEGPGAALEAHTAARHGGHTPNDVPTITGRHVVISLLALAGLAWARRFLG